MQPDKERFFRILSEVRGSEHARYNIGTLKEKSLHLILKTYFEGDVRYHEIQTNGFVADIRKGGAIYEIETSGFSGLGPKLNAYLGEFEVWLVMPLARNKTLQWLDPETGELSKKRVSPRKENEYDLLFELVRILPYVRHEKLHVLGVMLSVEELRIADGWARKGKIGSHRIERVPADIYSIVELSTDDDYEKYIPSGCVKNFTVRDFAREAGALLDPPKTTSDKNIAAAVIKVMEARGLVSRTGKSGRAYTYSRTGR